MTMSPDETSGAPLLEPDEPAAVELLRADGESVFILTADHAGRAIPRRLHNLGLSPAELETHIAWDIGIAGVARNLSETLDAPLVLQRYSRLVIDCNRDPAVESSIAKLSEHTRIPGNESVSAGEALLRRRRIFDPYHSAIAQHLERRAASGRPAIVVALHSMTPVFKGQSRPMQTAVLYDRDSRFAHHVLETLRQEQALAVAENEPYFVSPATDYTIPHHAEGRFPYAEIEIRQDLISAESGQLQWSERLARVLRAAQAKFSGAA
jgi:predicted N-formylglutamate amidohydrolase